LVDKNVEADKYEQEIIYKCKGFSRIIRQLNNDYHITNQKFL